MKNEAHTEVSLMKADRDVLPSIHMRASRQMSYCPPLVDYTPLYRHKWLQKHMQMSLINMHFIQIKCKFGPWLLVDSFSELFATTFSLNELRVPLRPAFCSWPDASALLLICVQESGQEDSTPFCFLFTFLPRSVCQSPWRKHGRLLSSPFSRGLLWFVMKET